MRPITTLFIAVAAVGSLALVGCGHRDHADTPPPAATTLPAATNNKGPDWKRDPTAGGKYLYAAVGVSERKLSGESLTRATAISDARKQIAGIIKSKVEGVFKSWTREGGEITTTENKQMAMTMVEDVSRVVTNQSLEGSSEHDNWTEDATGRFYMWVYIDPAKVEEMKAATAAAARADAEKRAHFASKIEADKAFADLDKLIEKEMSGSK